MTKTAKIEPLDAMQCQAMKPNGYSFMTSGGVPGRERCRSVPSFVLVEREPGTDGLHGAMTVCGECFEVYKRQIGLDKTLVYSLLTVVRK